MSRIYRIEASVGLAELLLWFDVQDVPLGLIDFRVFREELMGLDEAEVRERAAASGDKFALPQLVHAAPINDHFPEFGAAEPERFVAGIGFTDQRYREEDEVAWFAAEIDSKLEADAALTLEWCDRLDAAADALGYKNYRIWLIAPEGFSDSALDILAERNGFGSSRRQAELLRDFLKGSGSETRTPEAVFEVVIPTGGEAELVAVHAFEEIARTNGFPAATVNQIKTALIEACINVSEHSSTPDGRIHVKFAVAKEKVTISVSNRGLRLTDRPAEETPNAGEAGRRGWGLGLIRNLMDEVRVVPVDDGTRIEMTKYLRSANKM
jgi:serine/threonine-protein kinase RsbW